ncbi:hypothetical protein PMZ80_009418 [Knufia obscura]|uniref:Uncharacterized protein n=2 Tax=Knufia TaxID=430999 RepID=A0AAN8EXK8_9EURO|nr:hypothetical protein PMZ80_009418 [Knufia obscura]KAK5955876.1 hypothetical protein OHC33_003517 [Knufia fluminis]
MAAAAVMAPTAPTELTSPASTEPAVLHHSSSINTSAPATSPSSNLLVQKISSALHNTGYPRSTIDKVSHLAQSNIVEAFYPSLDAGYSLNLFVRDELLDSSRLEERNLRLNSNEPVLLLEFPRSTRLTAGLLKAVKEDILTSLRESGIMPVRVYVRLIEVGVGVNVVLLNVVNTDIGGPSMVQLLDAAFHGEGWKEELVLKEGWRGEDLLWRDEVGFGGVADEAEQEAESTDVVAGEVIERPTEESQPAQEKPPQQKSIDDVPDEVEEVETDEIEHPAMEELREREAERPGVQHPPRSRAQARTQADPRLLDVITTQPPTATDTDPVSVIGGRSTESSDDGFEVVEKA